MSEHRYILEPYKGMNTRYTCPECNKHKCFTRYIDTTTGNHIHPSVGRCNREANCGCHNKPKQYFEQHNISFDAIATYHTKPAMPEVKSAPASFIPFEIFQQSRTGYLQNNFVQFLSTLFDAATVAEAISRYHIGTSKHWDGATVFWEIDQQGKIRTGKIMLYSPYTGKRIKEPYNFITWVHTALKLPEYNLAQCFFGEHLLKLHPKKTVGIVESEKTAIIASVYFPNFIWLAAGNKVGLNNTKCKVLTGRNVVLFPDLKAFDKWNAKAKELSNIASFTTSDLLENKASDAERQQGFDLADYLIKFDYRQFNKHQPATEPAPKTIEHKADTPEAFTNRRQPSFELWNIAELEKYFENIASQQQQIIIDKCGTVTDLNLFIQSHLATVKTNNGNPTYLPYFERLQKVKHILTNNNS